MNKLFIFCLTFPSECQSTEPSSKKNNADIVMINLSHVAESDFRIISTPEKALPMPPEYDLEKIERRFQNAKDGKLREAKRVGIDVTNEAQLLFNSISKL